MQGLTAPGFPRNLCRKTVLGTTLHTFAVGYGRQRNSTYRLTQRITALKGTALRSRIGNDGDKRSDLTQRTCGGCGESDMRPSSKYQTPINEERTIKLDRESPWSMHLKVSLWRGSAQQNLSVNEKAECLNAGSK